MVTTLTKTLNFLQTKSCEAMFSLSCLCPVAFEDPIPGLYINFMGIAIRILLNSLGYLKNLDFHVTCISSKIFCYYYFLTNPLKTQSSSHLNEYFFKNMYTSLGFLIFPNSLL